VIVRGAPLLARAALLLVPALLACDDPASVKGGKLRPADFAGESGMRLTFAPVDALDDPPLLVTLRDASWEARVGEPWDTASPLATWTVTLGTKLVVDDTTLLPADLPEPGEVETRYGTFADTVTITVKEGHFAGRWAFAQGIGPVVTTLDGTERECVYYEREVEEDEEPAP